MGKFANLWKSLRTNSLIFSNVEFECPGCGETIKEQQESCPHCGRQLL
ncbi:zinc ribbon domain-containing protein [Haladaptatus pallidirubidus]